MTLAPAATSASSEANVFVPSFFGGRLGARRIEIGDADQLDELGQRVDGVDVELADVSGADHAGAKACARHVRLVPRLEPDVSF